MLNEEVLKNDLYLLSKGYDKVIEVNLDEDTYFEVKVDEDEQPHIYKSLRTWVDGFVKGGGVHPEDVERFYEFFDLFQLKKEVILTKKWPRIFYRRKFGEEFKYVCMEVIPMDNFSHDEPIVLITVRQTAGYVKDFCDQVFFRE